MKKTVIKGWERKGLKIEKDYKGKEMAGKRVSRQKSIAKKKKKGI